MLNRWRLAFVVIVGISLLGLYLFTSVARVFETPSATVAATSVYAQLTDNAQQKWNAHGITDYRIVLRLYEGFLNNITTVREVTVKGGQVVTASCDHNACPAFALRNIFTVDDLFGLARGSSLRELFPDSPRKLDNCLHGLVFDATYGYPKSMSFNCPDSNDMSHSVEVTSFEPLQ